jgi:hypothetical protein
LKNKSDTFERKSVGIKNLSPYDQWFDF